MRHALKFASLAALLCLASVPAWCAPVTETFTYSFSGFIDTNGTAVAPFATMAGSFTLTFDPTLDYTNSTTGLAVNSLTGPTSASALVFSYSPGSLSFGGASLGAGLIGYDTNDFVVQFNTTDLADPGFYSCKDPGFTCGASGTGNQAFYSSGYTTTSDPTDVFFPTVANGVDINATPEPSSFVLLASGLAGLGGMVRGRRRKL